MKQAVIENWLSRDPDPHTRAELQGFIDADDQAELSQRFHQRLKFGTAGLRGKVGAGPARINRLVVMQTSAGLGASMIKLVKNAVSRGVVVSFDGRPDSRQFAQDTACVFAGLGFQVFLTRDVAATPICSYGIKQLCAAGGVAVTASHNPPDYNGYKVFWDKGCQIVAPLDNEIAAAIEHAATNEIPWMEFQAARASGQIQFLGDEFYAAYYNAILASPLFAGSADPEAVSIAYTPLHGVGANMVESLLEGAGFNQVYTVTAQREPDGNFPTVTVPNPEEPAAMTEVLQLARRHNTTLACATDPDADRLAVAVRTRAGDYQLLTGDQVGVLLAQHALELSTISAGKTPLLGTTIVSSRMLKSMAEKAGARYYETLSGCKWLADAALKLEDPNHEFLFAYEEAIGYTFGSLVRDKDGISALLAFTQFTARLAAEGQTVITRLEQLYREHGYFVTGQRCIAAEDNTPLGARLRNAPPQKIAGKEVVAISDLKIQRRMFADGTSESIPLPCADVLIYLLEDDTRVILRPSGTEPKIKCYYELVRTIGDREDFATARSRCTAELDALIEQHQASLSDILATSQAR